MDNLHTPQTAEQKQFLEQECGLVAYEPIKHPNWADPDHASCKPKDYKLTELYRPHGERSYFRLFSCR